MTRTYKSVSYAFVFFGTSGCLDNTIKQENKVDQKPNIVFILADDLGYSQLGCYGSDYYQTPNIDALAMEGTRFTNAYAAAAVCSPTRASIMTGKYPARLHVTDFIPGNSFQDNNLKQPEWQKFLPLEEKTLAEVVKQKGYKTAIFGKWHLSSHKRPPESLPYNPNKQGFDNCFVTYKPGSKTNPEKDAHNVDSITRASVEFIEKNKNNPFFLMISHNSIHDPLMEKEERVQKYKEQVASLKAENHPVIAAMIETLDKHTGIIMDKIDELKLTDNTIVIFFSDNGGKHSYASQKPLRDGKGWLYEGGIRVPLIIRWPGKIKKNSIRYDIVCSIDFMPTFMEITGGENDSQMDGISILPVLFEEKKSERNTLFWHYPHYHKGSGMQPASAIRKGRYKLIEWHEQTLTGNGLPELYDLSQDISESVNLADSLPKIREKLYNELIKWRTNIDAQMPAIP